MAEASAIPQLKRVIVSDGEKLAMEPTLRDSLNVVFSARTTGSARGSTIEGVDNLSKARKAVTTAEEALRDGDWTLFGRTMQKLKQLLGE